MALWWLTLGFVLGVGAVSLALWQASQGRLGL